MDASALQQLESLLQEETGNEFDIIRLLGRGGMAMVYLAVERKLSRKVAIKVLPPELTFGHGVPRFLREARTAAALDHPHIIPIYRIADEGKLFWYAMKYLEGRSLEDALKEKKRLELPASVEILTQVADALDYAHQHQVIHRDIKPANVMLDSRNRVVITDFGIAKALTEGALTASGSVIGTPFFMSPEQGMGKPVSGASDQYSVGVMAFRMLAGEVPFDGDSAIDILHKHCMMPPPSLEQIRPGLPAYVYRAVNRALEKDPQRRFKTVTRMVKALGGTPDPEDSAAEMATVQTTTGGPVNRRTSSTLIIPGRQVAPRPAAPAKKSRTGLIVAASAVVIAGSAAAIVLSRKDQGPAVQARPESTTVAVKPETVRVAALPDTTPLRPPVKTPQPARTPPRQAAQRPASTAPTPVTVPSPAQAQPAGDVFLIVNLSPAAFLYIDGVAKGEQARYREALSPGAHLIRVEKDGFVARDTTVNVKPGEQAILRVTLQPRSE